MRSLKIRTGAILMTACSMFVLLLLLSDVCYYLQITQTGLFTGIVKTAFYAGILLCAVSLVTLKHLRLDISIKIFFCFTGVTLISTALGVPTDISVQRQLIHLTFFAAAFVVSYVSTGRMGILYSKKYLLRLMWLFAILFCVVLVRGGLQTQNVVYYLIVFLPVLALLDSCPLRIVLSIFMAFLALISNKRTVVIAVVAYFLCRGLVSNRNQTKTQFIGKTLLCIISCLFLYFILPAIIQAMNITVFKELDPSHILEDGGSNRFYIYDMLWAKQTNSGLLHWLFGDGYNSVFFSQICQDGLLGEYVSAHNDYLEVLYDYGVVGLALYFVFLGLLLKRGLAMIRGGRKYGPAFFSSVIMVMIISISSHLIIYLNYYVILFIFWGMCLADYNKSNREMSGTIGGTP